MNTNARLSQMERILLLVPLTGGIVFGLGPLLIPGLLARTLGYSGNDPYIYRLAGAATFGYAMALALAIREDDWQAARLVVAATLTFNLASLFACTVEILGGRAQPVVYLLLLTSLAIVAIIGSMLRRHAGETGGAADIPRWLVWLVVFATAAAMATGLVPLLAPEPLGRLLGYKVTDVILFRQGGAATLGYALMGILELRSRRWHEMRLPAIMGITFNGLALVVTLLSIAQGDPVVLPAVVLLATMVVTTGSAMALARLPDLAEQQIYANR